MSLISEGDSLFLKEYCSNQKIRVGSLMQKIIKDILQLDSYYLVVQNVPRKAENDISIVNVLLKENDIQNAIDMAIEENLTGIKTKKDDLLVIINNKDNIYELLKKYSIIEKHTERNGFDRIIAINLQSEIDILIYDYSSNPIDINIFNNKFLKIVKELKNEYLSN